MPGTPSCASRWVSPLRRGVGTRRWRPRRWTRHSPGLSNGGNEFDTLRRQPGGSGARRPMWCGAGYGDRTSKPGFSDANQRTPRRRQTGWRTISTCSELQWCFTTSPTFPKPRSPLLWALPTARRPPPCIKRGHAWLNTLAHQHRRPESPPSKPMELLHDRPRNPAPCPSPHPHHGWPAGN